MKKVSELSGTMSGRCYLIGKGQSIDFHQFSINLPIVCVNDACTAFPGCDYVISGSDEWSKQRIDSGKWGCANLIVAELGWGEGDYYYQRQLTTMGELRDDTLYCESRKTATSALSFCKLLGFEEVLMLGFGDRHYALRWGNLNFREYNDDSDGLIEFANKIGIKASILLKVR